MMVATWEPVVGVLPSDTRRWMGKVAAVLRTESDPSVYGAYCSEMKKRVARSWQPDPRLLTDKAALIAQYGEYSHDRGWANAQMLAPFDYEHLWWNEINSFTLRLACHDLFARLQELQ